MLLQNATLSGSTTVGGISAVQLGHLFFRCTQYRDFVVNLKYNTVCFTMSGTGECGPNWDMAAVKYEVKS